MVISVAHSDHLDHQCVIFSGLNGSENNPLQISTRQYQYGSMCIPTWMVDLYVVNVRQMFHAWISLMRYASMGKCMIPTLTTRTSQNSRHLVIGLHRDPHLTARSPVEAGR